MLEVMSLIVKIPYEIYNPLIDTDLHDLVEIISKFPDQHGCHTLHILSCRAR